MRDMENTEKENTIYGFQGDYRFLSNFDPTPIVYGGLQIKTAEHLYNALKTTSLEEALSVLAAETPGQAKKVGRTVTLKDNWETEKFTAMRTTIGVKFIGNLLLSSKLVETGDKILIEANEWHDQIWGDCFCGRPACEPAGLNNLGELLMELRTDLARWI
jgi:ribA/ribD-fused uncharacterized protein